MLSISRLLVLVSLVATTAAYGQDAATRAEADRQKRAAKNESLDGSRDGKHLYIVFGGIF
jgi:hypothetical protein